MKLPFLSRRKHDHALAEIEDKRRRLARWLADEKSSSKRLTEELAATTIVNVCLTEELGTLKEQLAEARALADDSLASQLRAQVKRERRRGDRLQKQYDDAVGMNSGRGDVGLNDSEHWKPPFSLDAKGVAS